MTALTANNNAGESRWSHRAAGVSYIMRPFNRSATEKVNKFCKEKSAKEIKSVERRQHVEMFAKQIGCSDACTENNRASTWADKCRKLLEFIDGVKNRISRVDLEARKKTYAKGVKNQVTLQIDRGITMSHLKMTYGEQINAAVDVASRRQQPLHHFRPATRV